MLSKRHLALFPVLVVLAATSASGVNGLQADQHLPTGFQEREARESGRQNDYARLWESYQHGERIAYVHGFLEGHMNGALDAVGFFDGKAEAVIVNRYRDTTWDFAGVTVGVLANVMTDLYRDRANSLIPFTQILYISREKLKGSSIEDMLQAARSRATAK